MTTTGFSTRVSGSLIGVRFDIFHNENRAANGHKTSSRTNTITSVLELPITPQALETANNKSTIKCESVMLAS